MASFYDSFTNFLAGLGIVGRDKAASQQFVMGHLNPVELQAAYRGDWIARKVVDIPSFDMTRAWRSWHASKNQIKKLEEIEKVLGLKRKMMQAISKARLYGGAVMIMGIDQGKFSDELDVERVRKDDLKFIHVVGRYSLAAGGLIKDITSPYYGEPSYYMRSNTITTSLVVLDPSKSAAQVAKELGYTEGSFVVIHPSRVVRFVGNEYPDMDLAQDAWGDSVLQTVQDSIRDAGMVSGSVAAMISEAKLDVIKIPGLTNMMSTTAGAAMLSARFANANAAKSVINSILIDTTEDWDRKEIHFTGIPDVLQMYLMIACAASDIPATRMLSKSPDGMNASGASDIRNYYDRLVSDQEMRITPVTDRLDEVMIRSVFGSRDPNITYEWNSLWQMSDSEKADIALKKAQAYKIDVDAAIIPSDILLTARENQLIEDGFYPGLQDAIDEAEAAGENEVPEVPPVTLPPANVLPFQKKLPGAPGAPAPGQRQAAGDELPGDAAE